LSHAAEAISDGVRGFEFVAPAPQQTDAGRKRRGSSRRERDVGDQLVTGGRSDGALPRGRHVAARLGRAVAGAHVATTAPSIGVHPRGGASLQSSDGIWLNQPGSYTSTSQRLSRNRWVTVSRA